MLLWFMLIFFAPLIILATLIGILLITGMIQTEIEFDDPILFTKHIHDKERNLSNIVNDLEHRNSITHPSKNEIKQLKEKCIYQLGMCDHFDHVINDMKLDLSTTSIRKIIEKIDKYTDKWENIIEREESIQNFLNNDFRKRKIQELTDEEHTIFKKMKTGITPLSPCNKNKDE